VKKTKKEKEKKRKEKKRNKERISGAPPVNQ